MKLINRWTLAAEAAADLRRQPTSYGRGNSDWRAKTQAALDALGPSPHPDEVTKLWPGARCGYDPRCDECNKYVAEVVQMGEEPDYESSTAKICAACLMAAMKLIEP